MAGVGGGVSIFDNFGTSLSKSTYNTEVVPTLDRSVLSVSVGSNLTSSVKCITGVSFYKQK